MCGLIGIMAYGEFEDKKEEKTRQESMIFLLSELLQVTQTRGKDATGITTLFSNCDFMGLKMGVAAQDFVSRFGNTEKDFSGYLNIWRKNKFPAKITLGHCRKPTTGGKADTNDNNNNHPIRVGDIVAVHNGTLTNHERIFKKLDCKRDGTVDSEAIVRLINHYVVNTEPFSKEMLQEVCKRLHGSYAVMAYNGNNPYQLAAFRDGRPLELAIVRPLKLALIASEKDFLKTSLFRYNQMAHLYQTGATKFIPLGKGDVDLELLTDDSLYLFDLRDDITKNTKVSDLYITEKVPRTDKIWGIAGGSSTSVVTGDNHTRVINGFNNINKSGVDTSGVADDDEEEAAWNSLDKEKKIEDEKLPVKDKEDSLKSICLNRVGMAWNRDTGKFNSIDKSEETGSYTVVDLEETTSIITSTVDSSSADDEKKTGLGNSELDLSSQNVIGEAVVVSHKRIVGSKNQCDLTETSKPPDDLIEDPAKIIEIKIDRQVPNKSSQKDTDVVKDAITMLTHPDVVEKSILASKEESLFSNNSDLCNAIEISDETMLKSIPSYSLGNRMRNYFFRRGYQVGYVDHEKEISSGNPVRNMLVRSKNKLQASQQNIRVLKAMVKLLCAVVDNSSEDMKSHNETQMKSAVTKICSANTEFTVEQIEKVFKRGDTCIHPTIQSVMNMVGKV